MSYEDAAMDYALDHGLSADFGDYGGGDGNDGPMLDWNDPAYGHTGPPPPGLIYRKPVAPESITDEAQRRREKRVQKEEEAERKRQEHWVDMHLTDRGIQFFEALQVLKMTFPGFLCALPPTAPIAGMEPCELLFREFFFLRDRHMAALDESRREFYEPLTSAEASGMRTLLVKDRTWLGIEREDIFRRERKIPTYLEGLR